MDHVPAGDLPAPVENAPEEGVSPMNTMVGAANPTGGDDHVEIAPAGAGDHDKTPMIDLETPTVDPAPIANAQNDPMDQTPITNDMTNGDDKVDSPSGSTDELLRAPTRRLDSFAEPTDDGADVASDKATNGSDQDAQKLLALQQPAKPLQRREQLGSDFRSNRQGKAKAKAKAKGKAKSSPTKPRAKAKASSPKSKAKKSKTRRRRWRWRTNPKTRRPSVRRRASQ